MFNDFILGYFIVRRFSLLNINMLPMINSIAAIKLMILLVVLPACGRF